MEIQEFLEKRKKELQSKKPTDIKAANDFKELIETQQKVYIVADYDCDGICAAACLYLLLKEQGKEVKVRFPKRISEGYGLSNKIIEEIKETIPLDTIICTVDNGTRSVEQIAELKKAGYKVIVTDHHLAGDNLPSCDVYINESDGLAQGNTPWSGAGLIFALIDYFDISEISKRTITFLAGVAAVGDAVPLINGNRRLVKASLQVANETDFLMPGCKALLKIASNELITEETYGFSLAPLINACGRLIDNGAEIMFKAITQTDPEKARQQISFISYINEIRKDLTFKYMQEITDKEIFAKENVIVIEKDMPTGLKGLIAGKLCEKYNVPVFVFSPYEYGFKLEGKKLIEDEKKSSDVIKGSVRSPEGINIFKETGKVAKLTAGFGGHAAAMGIALKKGDIDIFREEISKVLPPKQEKQLKFDVEFKSNLDELYKAFKTLAPYGVGNPPPMFLFKNFKAIPHYTPEPFRVMGKRKEHVGFYNGEYSAVGFFLADKFFEQGKPLQMDLVFTPTLNIFRGKPSVQMSVIDFKEGA